MRQIADRVLRLHCAQVFSKRLGKLGVFTAIAALAVASAPAAPSSGEFIGYTAGVSRVSNTGEATYSIPIELRTATGGMRPNISLSYSHRGGTGVAGQGWALRGISRITRCGRTLAQDNEIKGVTYTSTDRFCLDGQRLVLISGVYGAAGSEYRTEIESFRKIVANGAQGSGPKSFTVWNRDGTQHSYGDLQNASLTHTPTNSYRFWARYRTEDKFGNEINYTYLATQSTGEFLLDKVEYTSNSAQSLSARYQVLFAYQARPTEDQRSGFVSGALWSQERRLSTITHNLLGAGAGEISKYTLSYGVGTSGRSQLASVQQCRGNDCLLKSEFDWQDVVVGWAAESSSGQSSSGYSYELSGDFNGDGQQDLFVVKNNEWHVLTASNGNFSAPIDTNKSAPNAQYTMALDFNGDGKEDLLVPGSDSKWHVYLSTGTGFTDINTGEATTGYTESYAQDVDGDGLDDLLYKSGTAIYLRKSIGSDFSTTATQVYSWTFFEKFIGSDKFKADHKLDFNGDGRGDILVYEYEEEEDEYGVTVYEWWDAYVFNGSTYSKLGRVISVDRELMPADFNGDGLTDILVSHNTSMQYRISSGSSLGPLSTPPFFLNFYDKAIIADYNADGRDDVLIPQATTWYACPYTAVGFSSSTCASIGGSDPLNTPLIPMDVSGSGHDELVLSHANLWKIKDHNSPLPDVIT